MDWKLEVVSIPVTALICPHRTLFLSTQDNLRPGKTGSEETAGEGPAERDKIKRVPHP